VARLVRLCLQKDPEARLQSVRDVHTQLDDLARELDVRAFGSGGPRLARASPWLRGRPLGSVPPLAGRRGATALLAGVALLNWVQTSTDSALRTGLGLGVEMGTRTARAFQWLEGGLSFEHHDATNAVALYGYSIAYFFLLPAMLLVTLLELARREDAAPYRVYCRALAATYLLGLPFFVLFPVPERWAFPDSEAVLLSDLWSSRLIETIRPISGLDNCFPSFHVSSTVALILVSYLYRSPHRTLMVPLGAIVVLSTFVLGIHWIGDVLGGVAAGIAGVALALRFESRRTRPTGYETIAATDTSH
jgi:membrane-associated phospholipid phosphatase